MKIDIDWKRIRCLDEKSIEEYQLYSGFIAGAFEAWISKRKGRRYVASVKAAERIKSGLTIFVDWEAHSFRRLKDAKKFVSGFVADKLQNQKQYVSDFGM